MLDTKINGLYCYKSNRDGCVIMSENIMSGYQKISSKQRLDNILSAYAYNVKIYKNGRYMAWPTSDVKYYIYLEGKEFIKFAGKTQFEFAREIGEQEFEGLVSCPARIYNLPIYYGASRGKLLLEKCLNQ